ncbi:MAG: hypothetical protein HOQ02_04605 [Lysobacter sp.]|nr:hypothetical protein [Lysobacter sp.]
MNAQPDHIIKAVQATAPERIYLTLSDVASDASQPFPSNHEGICWCEDAAVDVCVPYVRADLAALRHPDALADGSLSKSTAKRLAIQGAVADGRECEHEWRSADNRYVTGGVFCLKCHAIQQAEAAGSDTPAALRHPDALADGRGDGTPSSRWAAEGKPDPQGDRYAVERGALAHGDLTDDELANAVFLCDHRRSLDSIGLLTAAKDRIRWLSRKLAEATPAAPQREGEEGDWGKDSYKRMFLAACDALGRVSHDLGLDPDDGGAEPILAAIAELEAASGTGGGAPEGFVLVPRVPTPKMIGATWTHSIDVNGGHESQNTRNRRIWDAMVAAAIATPPSPDCGEG